MPDARAQGKRNRSAGKQAERDVFEYLEERGWVCAWSSRREEGFDILAARLGQTMLVEVKSSPLPFSNYSPSQRRAALRRAVSAGALVVLAHRPFGKGKGAIRLIPHREWPKATDLP